MTIFSEGVDALFIDPAIGLDATFTPQGGPPVAVRIVLRRHDQEVDLIGTPVHRIGYRIDVRWAEVGIRPKQGDAFLIGAQGYTVRSSRADPLGLTWVCDGDAA